MGTNDKDYFDWLADLSSGGRGFYDLNGDGHIDPFEGALMLSDMEEERREVERKSGTAPYLSGTSEEDDDWEFEQELDEDPYLFDSSEEKEDFWGGHEAAPPSGSQPQGCGCFLASGWFWLFFILWELLNMYAKWKY